MVGIGGYKAYDYEIDDDTEMWRDRQTFFAMCWLGWKASSSQLILSFRIENYILQFP